jgi:hypothetical protein
MPRIVRFWLAASLLFLAGAANLSAQPAPQPKLAPTAAKPAATKPPATNPAATKPPATKPAAAKPSAPQIARDPFNDYPASGVPGVIFAGPKTMEFLKRLGPNAVFFTTKDHPLERLADLTDTDSQFGAWGIPPFSVNDLFNLKAVFGGKPDHLRMIGNLNFAKLFAQNPKLKLFLTSSTISLVDNIERTGGGMKVEFKLFDASAGAAPPAPDQKSDAATLAAQYPTADLAAREMMPGVYEFTILKANTQIGTIGVGNGGPTLNMAPAFLGKNLVFLGPMSGFIGVAGSRDFHARIVNVAALDYDADRKTNPPLSALGVVALNDAGVVKSDAAKTGWINWRALVKFDDGGRSRTVQLNDVTLWVNRGGDNWLSFAVASAQEVGADGKPGAKLPVTVSLDSSGQNGSVTIRIADKYAFHPAIKNYTTLDFVAASAVPAPAPAAGSEPPAQPTMPAAPVAQSAPPPSSGTTQAPASDSQPADSEAAAWKIAEASGTPAAYREFYRKYPRSPLIKAVTATVRGRYWYMMNDPQNREGVIVSAEGVAALVNLSVKDAIDEKVIDAGAATSNAAVTASGMTFNYVYIEALEPWLEAYGNVASSGGDKVTLLRPTDSAQSVAILSADGARLLSWDLSTAQPATPSSTKATFVASAAQAPPFNDVPPGISKQYTPFSQGVRMSHAPNNAAKPNNAPKPNKVAKPNNVAKPKQ